MLRIEEVDSEESRSTLKLSGRLTAEHLDQLRQVLRQERGRGRDITLDLSEVDGVDREAVRFLVRREGSGCHLVHAPSYLAEWFLAEGRRRGRGRGGRGALAIAVLLLWTAAGRAETLRLSLKQAVERALSEGTAARIASERIDRSRAAAREARSSLLPQAAAAAGYSNQTLNLQTFGLAPPVGSPIIGPFDVFDAHASIALRIVDLAARSRYRAARRGVAVSGVERDRTENEVAAAVATLYVALQRAGSSVEATQATVELFTKLRDLAEDRRTAGVATKLDSTRAGVALARERQALLVAQNRREAARLALLHAIAQDQSDAVVPTDPLAERAEAPPSPEEALATARRSRPELRAIGESLAAARLAVDAEKAEKLPTLGFQFQGGWNGDHATDLFWTRSLGALVSVPIFTGGRVAARVAQAESRERELRLQRIEINRQIEEEVRRAILAWQSAKSRVEVATENEKLSLEELDFARDRFANGVSSSIEVDNAQTSLARAREDRIAALADEAQARFDLALATGRIREEIAAGE